MSRNLGVTLAMTKQTGNDDLKGGIKGDSARRERLAAQLRANLKRRKAKGRAAEDKAADGDDAAAGGGADGEI